VTAPYTTPFNDVCAPPFVQLGSIWITDTPLLDYSPGGPTYARLTYRDALAIADARFGARLPTRDELLALHEAAAAAGTELRPVTLPADAEMASLARCIEHDAKVQERFEELVICRPCAFAGIGKQWIRPAPQGRAALCGWWVDDVHAYDPSRHGPGFVQQGLIDTHNDEHCDYSMCTMLVRDSEP